MRHEADGSGFKTVSESRSIRRFNRRHLEYSLAAFTAPSPNSTIPALWSLPRSNLCSPDSDMAHSTLLLNLRRAMAHEERFCD
jgi:hypothetical protein